MAKYILTLRKCRQCLLEKYYEMPFKTTVDTQSKSFQFRLIHRTIACNEWLNNLTIKSTNKCNVCEHTDSIIHFFFINCEKTNQFWKTCDL